MRLNIFGLVVGAMLAALLIAWGIAGAAPADQYACRWYYMPVIFGTLPDDTTDPLPGEVFPDGPLVCVDGDPQQPTPVYEQPTATPEETATVAPTPEATATATATIEPTATVGVTETVTPEATATCDPDDDDDDSIGTMGGGHDDNDCDDDD